MITTFDNYDLSKRNTFAMKVKCSVFMEYTEANDIPFILSSIRKDVKSIHIGAGSNLLFTNDFPGVVLHSAIKGIDIVDETQDSLIVRAGSGEIMDDLIRWTCDRNLWGLENLSGIPGEVGASAVQNVGAYGTEACDAIVTVHAFDRVTNEFISIDRKYCAYGYRDSIFKKPDSKDRYIINSVDYRLSPISAPRISYPALRDMFDKNLMSELHPHDVRKAVITTRDSKLPAPDRVPSAGSFFKNPIVNQSLFEKICENENDVNIPHYMTESGYKIPAAWLIDRCGWKGHKEGNVAVWHLQPLVIVNPEGKASPSEVINLEKKIIESVYERFGVNLHPEVEHI